MKWNFWCSDSVKSAEGVDSRRRAATARPHGPAPTISTSWTGISSSNSVMARRMFCGLKVVGRITWRQMKI